METRRLARKLRSLPLRRPDDRGLDREQLQPVAAAVATAVAFRRVMARGKEARSADIKSILLQWACCLSA